MIPLDLAETRLNGLDRIHKIGRFHEQPTDEDRRNKAVAKLAFAAYEDALRQGDAELAEAARKRFVDASERLRGRR